jgi:hypothetical protein
MGICSLDILLQLIGKFSSVSLLRYFPPSKEMKGKGCGRVAHTHNVLVKIVNKLQKIRGKFI